MVALFHDHPVESFNARIQTVIIKVSSGCIGAKGRQAEVQTLKPEIKENRGTQITISIVVCVLPCFLMSSFHDVLSPTVFLYLLCHSCQYNVVGTMQYLIKYATKMCINSYIFSVHKHWMKHVHKMHINLRLALWSDEGHAPESSLLCFTNLFARLISHTFCFLP